MCPHCQTRLFYFNDLDYYYCPECLDVAYDYDGNVIGELI